MTLSQKPQLFVIIPSFNSRKTIEACLESLKNQATDKTFEIIVVDSSADAYIEMVVEKFPTEWNTGISDDRLSPGKD